MKRVCITTVAMFFLAIASAQTFTLHSTELGGQATNKQVFNGFGCTGQNISPQLSWDSPPAETKSFAVTVYDENAPTGSGWWHWLIFDIPANVTELKSGAGNVSQKIAPANAIQSLTDFKASGYGGPCPPEGRYHKYVVTVFALKSEKLGLDANANPPLVGFMLEQNAIQKASLVFYHRR